MLNNATISLIANAVGVGLITVSTAPSILRLGRKAGGGKEIQYDVLYEDKDGVATAESEAEYSVKWHRIIVNIGAGPGLACSIAFSVFSTLHHLKASNTSSVLLVKAWAVSLSWILVCIQVLDFNVERHPVQRFVAAVSGGVSSVLVFILLALSLWFESNSASRIGLGLSIAELVLSAIVAFGFLAVPRRPDVFLRSDQKLCERQRSVSVLSRLLFTWPNYLLNLASTKTLGMDDLPGMDVLTRSQECHDAFPKTTSKLYIRIFWGHWDKFLTQWVLVLIATAFSFAPRFAMLNLLRVLERSGLSEIVHDPEAWLWVAILGICNLIAITIDTQLTWTMFADLAIPVRAELAALVFTKAMRKKDCKEAPKEAEKVEESEEPEATNGDATNGKKSDSKKADTPSEDRKKPVSEQGVINLIAVDANRVSQMCAWQRYYFSIVFGVTFACLFLLLLVGWKALLVGLATNFLALPLNAYFAQVYSNAQKKLMEARDKKVGVVTEALTGIRQIKFSALEEKWEDRLNDVRQQELTQLWRSFIADTVQRLAFTAGPVLLAAAALSTYVYVNGTLTASVAFTSLGVFSQLEFYLGLAPDMVTITLDAKISADRIDEFLNAEERVINREPAETISFDKVSVTFPSDDKDEEKTANRFKLRDINLQFPKNELSVISGKTGSGKTLLLSAILGEVDVLEGTIKVPVPPPVSERFDSKAVVDNWIIPTSMAYVSQIPWIEGATIKNNILFGLPFDEARYHKVIEACALTKDLDMLEDGDSTEVGAQGISLSGGQRWRLTFARALYSRAGILILDDLFSALDAHVGRHIFEKALTGDLCKYRTRILVTHHVALCLPQTKYAVFLADGTVERAGLIEELESDGGLTEILKAEEEAIGSHVEANTADAAPDAPVTNGKAAETPETKPKKLVEDEARETGGIKLKVYADYLNATGGVTFWSVVVVGFIIAQILTVSRSFWIKQWTASYDEATVNSTAFMNAGLHQYGYQEPIGISHTMMTSDSHKAALPVSDGTDTLSFYLGIYVAISATSVLISTARFLWLYFGSMRASRLLFAKLTATVLHMDLRWIDTTPLGRILNRFTADFSIVDARLSHDIAQTAASSFQVLGVVCAGLFVSPYMIVLALALMGLCLIIARKFLNGAREVKRLESICKSPIFEQFGSALKGVSTIRAFDNVEVFTKRMYSKIDAHSTAFWHISLFNRWMIFRMSLVGSVFSISVAILVIVYNVSPSLAGFALAFSLEFSQGLIFAIIFYANTELDMNAAERIIEYSNLEIEEPNGIDVPAAWPAEGKLEVKDLVVGYAEGLPDILKGLSFSVDKHERVGIVGRTGAGKSSVTLALFRFLKARSGTIHIDGIDISKIKLHDLRSRLAIIPQDPVLFSGTVRSNIDPFSQLEDYELKEALKRVHLVHSPESRDEVAESAAAAGDMNVNIFESLSSPISGGGLNLSQGQRQLLCLARAIVSRPKIMVLDEATSAVDMATDILIQRSIREEFSNTSLIVIAHRLSTISDFDKILVLEDGKAVEFGAPADLLQKKGVFYNMVGDSGEKEKIEEMIRDGVARVD